MEVELRREDRKGRGGEAKRREGREGKGWYGRLGDEKGWRGVQWREGKRRG